MIIFLEVNEEEGTSMEDEKVVTTISIILSSFRTPTITIIRVSVRLRSVLDVLQMQIIAERSTGHLTAGRYTPKRYLNDFETIILILDLGRMWLTTIIAIDQTILSIIIVLTFRP